MENLYSETDLQNLLESTNNKVQFELCSDSSAHVDYDGKKYTTLEANAPEVYDSVIGKHSFVFTSTEFPEIREKFDCEFTSSGHIYPITVALKDKVEKEKRKQKRKETILRLKDLSKKVIKVVGALITSFIRLLKSTLLPKSIEECLQNALSAKNSNNIEDFYIWTEKAAKKGHVESCLTLGLAFYNGNDIVENYDEALKWFKKGAAKGDEACLLNAGLMYAYGQGVPINYHQAIKYLEIPAKKGTGDVQAQYEMGRCYYKLLESLPFVDSTARSRNHYYSESVRWLTISANKGYAEAQFLLGQIYIYKACFYSNLSYKEQHQRAFDLLQKAKKQGHHAASEVLFQFTGAYWSRTGNIL